MSLQLSMPPDPSLLRVVRLVASGLTSLTDLGLDGVEGVRAGVDELVSTLIQASDGTQIALSFALDESELRVNATTRSSDRSFVPNSTSDRILDCVASRHRWHVDGTMLEGTVTYELAPRR